MTLLIKPSCVRNHSVSVLCLYRQVWVLGFLLGALPCQSDMSLFPTWCPPVSPWIRVGFLLGLHSGLLLEAGAGDSLSISCICLIFHFLAWFKCYIFFDDVFATHPGRMPFPSMLSWNFTCSPWLLSHYSQLCLILSSAFRLCRGTFVFSGSKE